MPQNVCVCTCCGQPTPAALPEGVVCGDCQRHRPQFSKARSPYRYTFPVDAALKRLKFGHQLIFAAAFAELLAPVVDAEFADCDVIVPVPLHRWRHIVRGFNQAREIARHLGRLRRLPVTTAA